MVAAVHHRHVYRQMAQPLGRVQAGKSPTHNDDPRSARLRPFEFCHRFGQALRLLSSLPDAEEPGWETFPGKGMMTQSMKNGVGLAGGLAIAAVIPLKSPVF